MGDKPTIENPQKFIDDLMESKRGKFKGVIILGATETGVDVSIGLMTSESAYLAATALLDTLRSVFTDGSTHDGMTMN